MNKRNVTIALDNDVARWARVRAAERDQSLSQLLADMLEAEMAREQRSRSASYQRAMREFLAIKPRVLRKPGERLPTREEMHER